MGIFDSDAQCEVCKRVLPKKQIAEYDRTHSGRIKGETKIKRICGGCMTERLFEDIRSFGEPIVFVYPMKKYNAYTTYHFKALIEANNGNKYDETSELVEGWKSLLPEDGEKCECCGGRTIHTWCSPDAIYGDPFKWAVDWNAEHRHLCAECLVKELKQKLEEEDIHIRYVYPPVEGSGVVMPWQC